MNANVLLQGASPSAASGKQQTEKFAICIAEDKHLGKTGQAISKDRSLLKVDSDQDQRENKQRKKKKITNILKAKIKILSASLRQRITQKQPEPQMQANITIVYLILDTPVLALAPVFPEEVRSYSDQLAHCCGLTWWAWVEKRTD